MLNPGYTWRRVVSVTSVLLYPQERAPVPIVEEAVGALYGPFIRHMSPASLYRTDLLIFETQSDSAHRALVNVYKGSTN